MRLLKLALPAGATIRDFQIVQLSPFRHLRYLLGHLLGDLLGSLLGEQSPSLGYVAIEPKPLLALEASHAWVINLRHSYLMGT